MGQCQSKPDVVNHHSGPLPSSTAEQESSHKEGNGANHQNGEPVTTSGIVVEGGEATSATATASLADSGLALAGPVPPPVVAPELPSGLRPVASPAPSSASFVSAVEELESLEMSLEIVALPAAHGTTVSGGFTPPTAAAMHAAERRASDGKAVHPPVPASDAKVAEGKAPAVPGTSARDSANGVPPPAAGERIRSPRELCLAPEMVVIWEKEMAFSAEQRKALKLLRDTLAAEGLLEGWLDNLPMLYRYLQARKWGVNEAMTMIRDTLEFRKKYNLHEWIDTVNGSTPKFIAQFNFPELKHVKAAYNFTHHKCDKEGRPVYFDRLGDMRYGAMINPPNSGPNFQERLNAYFVWYSEATWHYRLPAASLLAGKYIGKGVYIMDLKGFALSKHFTSETRAFIQSFIKMASDNYPETIYKTYIVNAPFIFRTVWAFVSKFLDERQISKFSIMGGHKEYFPKLLEVMDIKNIPKQYGGEDETCTFIQEQGPWQSLMPTACGPRMDP